MDVNDDGGASFNVGSVCCRANDPDQSRANDHIPATSPHMPECDYGQPRSGHQAVVAGRRRR